MKKIRKGNDIKVTWSLVKEGQPYSLEGVELSLYLKNAFGKSEITDFTISGNSVIWNFYGKDQKHVGKYTLEIVINENEVGMVTTDCVDFVYLTPETPCCEGTDDENITTETIELTSAVDLAPVVIQGEGGSGLKFSEERTIYGVYEEELTEEQRAYNIETYNKLMAGEAITANVGGVILTYAGDAIFFYQSVLLAGIEIWYQIELLEDGSVEVMEETFIILLNLDNPEEFKAVAAEMYSKFWLMFPYCRLFVTYNNVICVADEFDLETFSDFVIGFTCNNERVRVTFNTEGDILNKEIIPLGGGGGSVDPELLEAYMPLAREFSDDFNNDFAR